MKKRHFPPRVARSLPGFLLVGAMASFLTACAWLTPTKPTVEQGNHVDVAHLKQLHLGMTRDEVSELLGTPILNNVLEPNEWHYVYSLQQDKKPLEVRNITIVFMHDKVARITR